MMSYLSFERSLPWGTLQQSLRKVLGSFHLVHSHENRHPHWRTGQSRAGHIQTVSVPQGSTLGLVSLVTHTRRCWKCRYVCLPLPPHHSIIHLSMKIKLFVKLALTQDAQHFKNKLVQILMFCTVILGLSMLHVVTLIIFKCILANINQRHWVGRNQYALQ